MSFPLMKALLAGCFVLALGAATAAAAETTPAAPTPAASTPAAAPTPAPPTAAALGYAATILNDIGLKPSIERLIPGMFAELQREVLTTHPELKDPLAQAIQTITPDFLKAEGAVLDDLAKFLAAQLTEQELKEAAAFYESPTGKKFASAQGALTVYVSRLAAGWRDQMATDMLTRVHAELKKTGHDF